MRPDARHFCLLKGVRAVGGLNSCIHLARGGFTQELLVVVRTIVECTSLIQWALLEAEPNGILRADPQLTYVKKYFDDYRRDEPGETPSLSVRQGDVHRDLGNWLDEGARNVGMSVSAQRLMSNVYQVNSNYVHARYPEVMDLYGGTPPFFHLHGMSSTPKDAENVEVIEAYATTVAQSIVAIARRFGQGVPDLSAWLESQ
jgi:hypothetical protein